MIRPLQGDEPAAPGIMFASAEAIRWLLEEQGMSAGEIAETFAQIDAGTHPSMAWCGSESDGYCIVVNGKDQTDGKVHRPD